MFYKGIGSTMTHIGPQRVTPLGAHFSCILYSKFKYVLSKPRVRE